MDQMMTKTRQMVGDTKKILIVAYGLRQMGNQRPYFSITGEIPREAGGCLHDQIRQVFPELAELIPFHLCDSRGRPIHYIPNAIYWAELARGESVWQKSTNIPHGYETFEDVLTSHVLADVLGDREAMRTALYESVPLLLFRSWLESRYDRLQEEFTRVMTAHGFTL
jgi:hypothetical protein